MSLEARLRNGLVQTVSVIDVRVDESSALAAVLQTTRHRRRIRRVSLALAVVAIVVAGIAYPRVAKLVLSFKPPVPPAQERIEENRRDGDRQNDVKLPVVRGPKRPPARPTGDSRRRSGAGPAASRGATSTTRSPHRRQDASQPATARRNDASDSPGTSRREHSETKDYNFAALPARGGISDCTDSHNVGCTRFQAGSGDRYISVRIDDRVSAHVSGVIQIDRDGDGDVDGDGVYFCDATSGSLPIAGSATVYVKLESGSCDSGESSNPTRGTITIEFSNVR